jgi:hypothetical protein
MPQWGVVAWLLYVPVSVTWLLLCFHNQLVGCVEGLLHLHAEPQQLLQVDVSCADGDVVPSSPIYWEVHTELIRVLINPAHRVEPAADHSRHQLA